MEFKLIDPLNDTKTQTMKDISSYEFNTDIVRNLETNRIFNKDDRAFILSKSNDKFLNNKSTLVNKITAGSYNNLDRYADYINDGSHIKTRSKSILIKRLDKGLETNVSFDLDNKNYLNKNELIKDSLGDLEVPLVIPIKDMEGDVNKKYEPTLTTYKNSDIYKINKPYHRTIYTNPSLSGDSFSKIETKKIISIVKS